jgi:hypothetical protein
VSLASLESPLSKNKERSRVAWRGARGVHMRVLPSVESRLAPYYALAVLLGVASLISGCAHSLLYDENRDKQAQAAQKAATEAHVADAVTSLEKAFADVAAREEAFIRDREAAFFDREVIRVSRAKSLKSKFNDDDTSIDGLITVLRARLAELGLRTPIDDSLTELQLQDVSMKGHTKFLEEKKENFLGVFGHRFISCTDIYAESAGPDAERAVPSKRLLESIVSANPGKNAADLRKMVSGDFKDAVGECRAVDDITKKRLALFDGGLIRDASADWKRIDAEIKSYETAHGEAKKKIDEISANLPTIPVDKSALEAVEGKAKKIDGAFSVVTEVFTAAGVQALAEERLKHLQAILAAVAGSDSKDGKVKLTPAEQRSVAIVRDLPMLNDEANKLFKDAQKPRLVPILAAIDHEKLVLQGIEAVQEVKRRRLAAAQNRRDALLSEATSIARVLEPLAGNNWADFSIDALERKLSSQSDKKDLKKLYRALATYGDEVKRQRIAAEVWKSRELASMYEESLIESKFAAAQWDDLMDTIAKVLVDYHASGIKQADVAEFFKALGLVAIGVGVAQ